MQHSMIFNPHLEGEPFLWEAGPVGVLLSHGYTATTAEVRLLGQILHEHGYTVAAPLLRGHYTHPEDLNRVRWQDWLEDVEASYRSLSGCEHVFVGGESTGALLALLLASRHAEIRGVLAYAPALRLKLRWMDFIRLYLAAPFVPYIEKKNMDADTPWQGYPVRPLKGVLQLLRLQRVVRSRLPEVRQPVLIMQGRLDDTVHPNVPQEIAAGVRSETVEIHWMEKSGHVLILEQELGQVADFTLAFMAQTLDRLVRKE
jgi:carboxylesterase